MNTTTHERHMNAPAQHMDMATVWGCACLFGEYTPLMIAVDPGGQRVADACSHPQAK